MFFMRRISTTYSVSTYGRQCSHTYIYTNLFARSLDYFHKYFVRLNKFYIFIRLCCMHHYDDLAIIHYHILHITWTRVQHLELMSVLFSMHKTEKYICMYHIKIRINLKTKCWCDHLLKFAFNQNCELKRIHYTRDTRQTTFYGWTISSFY